jgi:hypothetical protein
MSLRRWGEQQRGAEQQSKDRRFFEDEARFAKTQR